MKRKVITGLILSWAVLILLVVAWCLRGHIWQELVIYNLSLRNQRRWAILQLGEIKTERAVHALISCIPQDSVMISIRDGENLDALHDALCKTGKRSVPYLISMLADGPGPKRDFAIHVLEWIYQTTIDVDVPIKQERDLKQRVALWLKSIIIQGQEETAIAIAVARTLSRIEGSY